MELQDNDENNRTDKKRFNMTDIKNISEST